MHPEQNSIAFFQEQILHAVKQIDCKMEPEQMIGVLQNYAETSIYFAHFVGCVHHQLIEPTWLPQNETVGRMLYNWAANSWTLAPTGDE